MKVETKSIMRKGLNRDRKVNFMSTFCLFRFRFHKIYDKRAVETELRNNKVLNTCMVSSDIKVIYFRIYNLTTILEMM